MPTPYVDRRECGIPSRQGTVVGHLRCALHGARSRQPSATKRESRTSWTAVTSDSADAQRPRGTSPKRTSSPRKRGSTTGCRASRSGATALGRGVCASRTSNHGSRHLVSIIPRHTAATRVSSFRSAARRSRGRTREAATWPTLDGMSMNPGHPSSAARPVDDRISPRRRCRVDVVERRRVGAEAPVQLGRQLGQRAQGPGHDQQPVGPDQMCFRVASLSERVADSMPDDRSGRPEGVRAAERPVPASSSDCSRPRPAGQRARRSSRASIQRGLGDVRLNERKQECAADGAS